MNFQQISSLKIGQTARNLNFICRTCGGNFTYLTEPKEFCSCICAIGENCLLCGESETVLHYDCVPLCNACKERTETDKFFWQVLFAALASGSKVVKKLWGAEIHIVNHELYCLKYLIFFAGCHFSHHYHKIKKELWHCLVGEFDMLLEDANGKVVSKFRQGNKIEIEPMKIHQLKAIKNSILVEVSTQSFDEDSYKDKDIIPERN